MEYMQLTIDDWLSMKEQLKRDLIGVQESFVRIGYTLRQIEEQKLYERDGYTSIAKFAAKEYHLSASTVSRFIAINKKYSVDGNSKYLRPEFADMGSSKLTEMLSLPDEDLELIRPEATRGSIRELKQFNKKEPEAEAVDEINVLIEKFWEDNPKIKKELYQSDAYQTGEINKMVEIVNPGGNRSYKKGIFFLMMYEEKIKLKKFGGAVQDLSWSDFFVITKEILEKMKEEKDFAEEVEIIAPAQMVIEPETKEESKEEEKSPKIEVVKISEGIKETKVIAPAQMATEEEVKKEQLREMEEQTELESEVTEMEEIVGSRKEYFDSNNQNRVAYCMARDLWKNREKINGVESRNELFRFFLTWLGENVNSKGYTVEKGAWYC